MLLENPGGTLDYNGRAAAAARHPARVLGGRQPVPSSPGPQPPAAGVRPARHGRRARAVLDGDRAPRRHRAADDHDPRARRHRRRPQRRLRDRDARARRPFGEARDDYEAFSELAEAPRRRATTFTEGRTARDWVRAHLRAVPRAGRPNATSTCRRSTSSGRRARPACPRARDDHTLFDRFRADPERAPLQTPSGRIELFSATIDGFGYDDCPGHPVWLEPEEWLGGARAEQFPLHLIANQPGVAAARPTRRRRIQPGVEGRRAANRFASTPTTLPHAASPTATSCACSTTEARASRARS